MRRKSRRRTSRARLASACLALALAGLLLLPNFAGTAASGPMQLVRLNVTTDSGFVRIEITADGSFDEASVEHYSRGHQSVIRIRGARSLLRQSYEINEALAREVRTVSGERDGEPYVDVLITLGDGATVAQKKNFNRLVIGVASDFARLRHRAPSSVDVAKARAESPAPREAANAQALPAPLNLPRTAMPAFAEANLLPVVNYGTEVFNAPAPLLASATTRTVFRGRTIWGGLPAPAFRFSRSGTAG
ncbi:MAG TPA: hypothetical protein VJT09_18305, partial [Pyrinomonadaceae bacterium]|nr:hypothetical protein [Pyrinomonadaceae bacterium]